MRKDYLPVDESARLADEAAFVEQHWTAKWRERDRPPDVSAVARREEYRLMKPYLDRLPRNSRVLDGGCGLGEWTVFLAAQGYDVVGIDISADTVRRLREWFPSCAFTHGDLRHTDFAPESFNAYFSWGTFEHFEAGPGGCITEAHRILKPGGWLFVSVPFHNQRLARRDARALERWDDQFDRTTGYSRPMRFYQWRLTEPELQRELEMHGFRVHAIVPTHKDTGVGRWLQWDLPMFTKGSRSYGIARRAFSLVLPARFVSHMIFAAAERR